VGELDLGGDPAPVLDRVLRDLAGVGGGAAGDDDDLVDRLEDGLVDVHLVEHEPARGVHPAEQGVVDGLRLVVDLLVHEGVEAALLRGGGVPVDLEGLAGDLGALEVGDEDRVRGDGDDLVLADLERLAGVVDERGDVGAEEVLPLAQADDERGVAARGDDGAGQVGVHGEQREGALELLRGLAHRLGEVAAGAVVLGELVGCDLGVGLRLELHAFVLECGLEAREVLDDAVVDERKLPAVGEVRVGVGVGGPAVGGPAGVTDAGHRLGQRVRLELIAQGTELAGLLGARERVVGSHQGDACGVVSAVFEPGESGHDDVEGAVPCGLRGGRRDKTYDSAHGEYSTESSPNGA